MKPKFFLQNASYLSMSYITAERNADSFKNEQDGCNNQGCFISFLFHFMAFKWRGHDAFVPTCNIDEFWPQLSHWEILQSWIVLFRYPKLSSSDTRYRRKQVIVAVIEKELEGFGGLIGYRQTHQRLRVDYGLVISRETYNSVFWSSGWV